MTSNDSAEQRERNDGKLVVCAILIDRANYGRLKPVMQSIDDRDELELQVLVGGTMVLERFQRPIEIVRADGFQVDGQVFMELEGSTPTTMAKSVGFGVVEFANEFQRLRPDIVLIIGDRYETLAACVAAAYMNLCIVHVQGGEISGSIDESARHAMTKFAHFHVPSTQQAAEILLRMGERAETILCVGCPSSDMARTMDRFIDPQVLAQQGSGAEVDPGEPYLLVVFHPTTTEFGDEAVQMEQLLWALHDTAMPSLLLWPNIDAGANRISKTIRVFRDQQKPSWLRLITNLPPEDYLRVLAGATCAVGNSSSFVRDGGFFGTPTVLVGDRQTGRQWDEHVTQVPVQRAAIATAIANQLAHGRYDISDLYGDGFVAERIAAALAAIKPYQQKRFCVNEPAETADQ